jgi:hypothetical protein
VKTGYFHEGTYRIKDINGFAYDSLIFIYLFLVIYLKLSHKVEYFSFLSKLIHRIIP